MTRIIKQLFKIILYGFVSIISIILIMLFSFWVEIKSNVTLPKPTGKFYVGRNALHWIDESRIDSLSPKPYSKRELVAWIWFPATITKSDSIVDYARAKWDNEIYKSPNFLFRNFFSRDASKIHAHAFLNPSLSDKLEKYPVLIMKSGIGMRAIDYTTIAEDLASHGYIVIGSDAPYSTFRVVFPDDRVIEKTNEGNPGEAEVASSARDNALNHLIKIWSDDTRFILDQIEQLNADSTSDYFGRIDTSSIGIFGHSFGGATAAQFCMDDSRCKTGVDMDGAPYGTVIQEGFHKPFMFLLADHADETDSVSMKIKSNVQLIYNALPQGRTWIYIKGAQHFNFSDMPFQREFLIMRLFNGIGSIGRRRGLEIISASLRTFFDIHLKKNILSEMDSLSENYSELRFNKK